MFVSAASCRLQLIYVFLAPFFASLCAIASRSSDVIAKQCTNACAADWLRVESTAERGWAWRAAGRSVCLSHRHISFVYASEYRWACLFVDKNKKKTKHKYSYEKNWFIPQVKRSTD